jgi:ornithine cyclodeaminase
MREKSGNATPLVLGAAAVRASLPYDDCIDALRSAMIAHSKGETRHLLRSFIALGEGRTFAQMPAALSVYGYFGAKLVSVFADPDEPARRAHRGLVVLFEAVRGEPVCVADAGAVTLIRTAAATALATDALARSEASVLAILGTGHQAESHIRALKLVRTLDRVTIWGRNPERAAALAMRLATETGLEIGTAADAPEAVRDADIVCTVTSSETPILHGEWLQPGTHVNLVGSSAPGPVEVDNAMVANSRFYVDCREHVIAHGAEFLRAKEAGLVGDGHIVAEIGEVLAGSKPGRGNGEEITVYKSLGHAVQDLAAVAYLYERLRPE